MKVATLLTLVITTSLAARISDRGSRRQDATKQDRLQNKPSGSFNIQLQGGHISRVDFGPRDTKRDEPNTNQARSEDHRFSIQATSKRPPITHKAVSTSGQTRLQKRNQPSGSTFNFNRQKANSQPNHSSSSSVPSHFTIQQTNTDNHHAHFNPPVAGRPIEQKRPHSHFNPPVASRPVEQKRPHNHFNPPVASRPVEQKRPHSHFNIPVRERPVDQKKRTNHFNPPIVVRPVQPDRPANAHFSPATFHFGTPSPPKASARRPDNSHRSSHSTSSSRRPESSNRFSSNPSSNRSGSSHRTQVTPGPKRSQQSSNLETNRSQTSRVFSTPIPKGINTSKFLPPISVKDDIDEFGPVDNSIQTPILSPNQPSSAKDIPTIYYPIRPKISPSNRVKA